MSIRLFSHEHNFVLHPSGAMFWEEESILLIADLHLGKVTHFRKAGIAIPAVAATENLNRLEQLTTLFQPKEICFLGDLFHSVLNSEWNIFQQWVREQKAKLSLVLGNHDHLPKHCYEELHMHCVSEKQSGGVLLTHEPDGQEGLFNICGHIHPAVRFRGAGGWSARLPCFYLKGEQLILPAFGEFTGNYVINPEAGDRVFALVEDEVIEISK